MPWQSRKFVVTLATTAAGVALAAYGLLTAEAVAFLLGIANGYNVANVFNKKVTS